MKLCHTSSYATIGFTLKQSLSKIILFEKKNTRAKCNLKFHICIRYSLYLRLAAVASGHDLGGGDEGSTTEVATADLEGGLPWGEAGVGHIVSSNDSLVAESRGG